MNYFLYARKSTDDEERQMLSIEAQRDELSEFAERESLTVVREFIESQTAKVPGRPIFNAMMEQVENGKAGGLLAWHPDRLARNSVDGGRIIYLLDSGELSALKFPTFWFDNTPQGKFMLNIAFGQSKYYVDNLSENVSRGIRQKLRRGEYPGQPPIGYLNEPRLRTIVVDEIKAPMIRRLFELYATGNYTFSELHDEARKWDLRTHRGFVLARATLPRLLSNTFYIGTFKFQGTMHEGTHDPIIPRDLFDRVQDVLRSRGRGNYKVKQQPKIFLGLLKCDHCGGAVTAERQKGHHYYRCTKKMGPCPQTRYIREEALADHLREALSRVSLSDDYAAKMLGQVKEWRDEEQTEISATLRTEEASLAETKSRADRLLEVYLDGTVSKEDYAIKKEELVRRIADIKERIKAVRCKGSVWLEPMEEFIRTANAAEKVAFSGSLSELRDFHRKIGSNLYLHAPVSPRRAKERRTRPSKERAGKNPHPDCGACPPKLQRRREAAARECASSEIHNSSEGNPSPVAEDCPLRASATPGRKSSSRYADDEVPALRVEYPNPWNLIAENRDRLKWSGRLDSN